MKNIKHMYSKITLLTGLLFVITMSCERDISDEAEFATLSKTGEIFTDSPIGLGSDFYFPYLGSKATAWSVDENEGYESQASMRFDVPNANDPDAVPCRRQPRPICAVKRQRSGAQYRHPSWRRAGHHVPGNSRDA